MRRRHPLPQIQRPLPSQATGVAEAVNRATGAVAEVAAGRRLLHRNRLPNNLVTEEVEEVAAVAV
jgi:hypothetical protein